MHCFANFLGNFISSSLNFNEAKREIVTYGAFVFLHNLSIITIIILVAIITGLFKEIIIVMLVFGLLRRFAGGIHFSTPLSCMVSSVIIFPLLGLTSASFYNYLFYVSPEVRVIVFLFISGITLVSVKLYAPREHTNNPLSPGRRARLKRYTFIVTLFLTGLLLLCVFWGAFFLREAASICMAFLFLSFNLLPVGKKVLGKLDGAFSNHFKKEAKSS
jgi:accessory gene regulator B